MYAKLFSRITESSLMEEPVSARYTFMMLLAIADPTGHVIGTDVAIARRINLPVPQFQSDIGALMSPDENSNSKAEDGRRVVLSEGERGYKIVNYLVYRDMKNEDQKRAYMRDYMRSYRGGKGSVKLCKTPLALLDHAEPDTKAEPKAENGGTKKSKAKATDEEWRAEMQSVKAYEHLDIEAEFSRALFWCKDHRRQCTRRFFTNWINRASQNERPMTITVKPQPTAAAPDPNDPPDWAAFLRKHHREVGYVPHKGSRDMLRHDFDGRSKFGEDFAA